MDSVALHPQIVDVNKDGLNDLVIVSNYVDAKGDDATNIKTYAGWKPRLSNII